MKIWKKLACLALCTTMSLSAFAACGESGGGKETEAQRRENAQASAKKYVQTVSDTLENAKSFNVSGKMEVQAKEEMFVEGTTTVDPTQTDEERMFFYLDVTLTQDGENNVALQMTAKSEEVEIEAGSVEYSYQMVMEAIVKDGYSYTRDYIISSDMTAAEKEEAKGLWYKEEITLPEEVSSIDAELFNSLLGAKEVKEFAAQIFGDAQEIIAEKFFNGEVAGGEVSWKQNFAPDFNEVVAFIESIDESKDTLGGVINKVLAEITDNVTVEGILTKVKESKTMTVAEAMTAIDVELAKQGTSLQGVYDAIVNSEVVNLILTEAGATAEDLTAIKAFMIEDVKTQYGAMTLGEVFNMLVTMMNGESEVVEPVDYFDEVVGMAEAALAATLEDLGIELPAFEGVQFNDMTIDTGLKLNAAGDHLEKLYLSLDLDVRAGVTSYDYDAATGKDVIVLVGYQYLVLNADLEISQFSSSTVVINAPAADQIQSPSYEG